MVIEARLYDAPDAHTHNCFGRGQKQMIQVEDRSRREKQMKQPSYVT